MGAAMAQMLSQSMQQPARQQEGAPATSIPQTVQEIQEMLDSLDARLMNGEISEDLYNKLRSKWETRLEELK
jgi:ElaB/YqjD/DUF883 family membrane-anchored ribosome-binding protein